MLANIPSAPFQLQKQAASPEGQGSEEAGEGVEEIGAIGG